MNMRILLTRSPFLPSLPAGPIYPGRPRMNQANKINFNRIETNFLLSGVDNGIKN